MNDLNNDIRPDEIHVSRAELLTLFSHYEGVVKDELDFYFKYQNFYVGLFSALLSLTIAGFFNAKDHAQFYPVILCGPILICMLSIIGYLNVRVYYRRFIEAAVIIANLKNMLGFKETQLFEKGIKKPLYPSKYGGGFLVQYYRKSVRKIVEEAQIVEWSGERLVNELINNGDTLRYTQIIFIIFGVTALSIFGLIIHHLLV